MWKKRTYSPPPPCCLKERAREWRASENCEEKPNETTTANMMSKFKKQLIKFIEYTNRLEEYCRQLKKKNSGVEVLETKEPGAEEMNFQNQIVTIPKPIKTFVRIKPGQEIKYLDWKPNVVGDGWTLLSRDRPSVKQYGCVKTTYLAKAKQMMTFFEK